MASDYIRVSVHSTELKFGRQPDPTKPTWNDQLKDSALAVQATSDGITTIGLDLSSSQGRALHALQVLLDQTNYVGNAKPQKPARGGRYHFNAPLPVLDIKTADYLRAYDVAKSKTHRGNEFSAQGRRVAMNALHDLADNRHLMVYEKSHAKDSKKIDTVEDIAPLISLTITKGGRNLRIVPNPVLVDQLDSYCMLKPREFFDLVTGNDAVEPRFLEFILYQAEQLRRAERRNKKNPPAWEVRLQPDVISWRVRLEGLIKARKKTDLRKRLTRLYDLGVKVGYLKSYQTEQPGTKGRVVDILQLDKNAFGFLVPDGAESTTK